MRNSNMRPRWGGLGWPRPHDDPAERLPRVHVTELCVERPEGEHLLFEVLENRVVHPRPEFLRGLPVPRVVREPAARGLELAGVDEMYPSA